MATTSTARAKLHFIGILGGMIWMIALCFNVIASGVAGPAISYALGQGATLIAAIWGVLVWRELAAGPQGTMTFGRASCLRATRLVYCSLV